MTNILRLGGKAFTISVVAVTILWSVGVAAVLAPVVTVAAECPVLKAGALFKVHGGSAVYYVNADMKRMYFFNSEIYHTWYSDFSGVVEIAPTCTSAYPSGGGVSYLAGSYLVKTTISNDVYAVLPNGELKKLASEAAAKALYGTDWAKKVHDIPASYFDTYKVAAGSLDGTAPHEGMLVKKGTVIYKVEGGVLQKIDGALPTFVSKFVRTPSTSVVDALEAVDTTTITATDVTKDVGQKVSVEKVSVIEKSPTSNVVAPKLDTSTNAVNGANYTGPFPAPEGMILTGTFGEDKFQEPTGNGTYRFRIQTAWDKSIACLDKTRTLVGSKGATWEEGYAKGFNTGVAAKESLIVIYDDTPQGAKAGKPFYNEGYKLGYDRGFENAKAPPYVYGCDVDEGFDISKYDSDGWKKQSLDKLPSLNALYMPVEGAVLSNLDSVLGSNGVVFSFDAINNPINKSGLNIGKPDLNISRMDFIEGQLDSAEAALTTAQFAQAFYSQQKKVIENKYKGSCTVADAAVTSEAYGSNNFTNLAFITVCLDSGGGENKWTLSKYSFMKIPGNKMLMISLPAASDVKTKGSNTTDSTKVPSKDFITQLYSKIQVK